MEDLEVKDSVPEDALEIIDFVQKIRSESDYVSPTKVEFWTEVAKDGDIIRKKQEDNGIVFLVARSKMSNEIVSVASATRKPRRKAHIYELGISVRSDHHRKGIGRGMMLEIMERVKQIPGARKVTLEVSTPNKPAIKMYEKLGFVQSGILREEVKVREDEYHDTYTMEKIFAPKVASSEIEMLHLKEEVMPTAASVTDFKPQEKLSNMNDFKIERCVPEDAEDIVEYCNLIGGETDFLTFGANQFHFTVAEEREFLKNAQDTNKLLIKARSTSTNEVISVASAMREPRRHSHVFALGISVKKKFWRRGVGEAMMNDLISRVKAFPEARKIKLAVASINEPAIKLYEKLGFVRTGVLKEEMCIKKEGQETVYHNITLMEKMIY